MLNVNSEMHQMSTGTILELDKNMKLGTRNNFVKII